MQILILGGGVFLGAAILRTALERGHELTVFNRGRAQSAWPGGVRGDRRRPRGRPRRTCRQALRRRRRYLRLRAGRCEKERGGAARRQDLLLHLEHLGLRARSSHPPIREIDPLADFSKIAPADRDLVHYGPQKAACEAEVLKVFGEHALIVRPGLIVGPGDRSGRFSHWPWRALEGGDMLVPDLGDDEPLQFIDVRDLGAWIVRLVERGERGAFNGTGPANGPACCWSELIAVCQDEAEKRGAPPAEPVPMAEDFLLAQGVEPWSELPLWLSSQDAENRGHSRVDIQRAEHTRLTTRPLEQTVAAVMDEGLPPDGRPAPPRQAHPRPRGRAARALARTAGGSGSAVTATRRTQVAIVGAGPAGLLLGACWPRPGSRA